MKISWIVCYGCHCCPLSFPSSTYSRISRNHVHLGQDGAQLLKELASEGLRDWNNLLLQGNANYGLDLVRLYDCRLCHGWRGESAWLLQSPFAECILQGCLYMDLGVGGQHNAVYPQASSSVLLNRKHSMLLFPYTYWEKKPTAIMKSKHWWNTLQENREIYRNGACWVLLQVQVWTGKSASHRKPMGEWRFLFCTWWWCL